MELFAIREEIWESTVRRSARQEKSVDFEDTTMWKKLKAAWEKKKGRPAPYAEVPRVTLESPKLSAGRSTAWFATNVKKRYEACRQR